MGGDGASQTTGTSNGEEDDRSEESSGNGIEKNVMREGRNEINKLGEIKESY